MPRFDLFRIAVASTEVAVGDPVANVDFLLQALDELGDCDLVVFPELAITGYTAADLFGQQVLLEAAIDQLGRLAEATRDASRVVAVGLPLVVGGSLYNVAAVLSGGTIAGLVPKQFIPTYREFYEGRWFRGALGDEPATVRIAGRDVPFGIDLLFEAGPAVIGVEICEDLWMPVPPSSFQAIAGANVLANLSASPENVGKPRWRTELVASQSGRCIAAYAYAGAGPAESTTDLVYGGHCLIAENGSMLGESRRIGDGQLPWQGISSATADVDLGRLQHDRQATGSFQAGRHLLPRAYRRLPLELNSPGRDTLRREVPGRPFVPAPGSPLEQRCAEVFGIQTAGLAKRVSRLPEDAPLVIGVSGGLDSTLALLAAVKACDAYRWPRARIHGITMPGFGTTDQTLRNAQRLMDQLEISSEQIDIRPLCLQTLRALQHPPLGIDSAEMDVEQLQQALIDLPGDDHHDLVFENVQARTRTLLLMSRGFVVGTGDLSEQALGWSTYNADHMSMYNVNTSVPKTLVRFLVHYVADHELEGPVRETLHEIAETTISPELLPPAADGTIRQSTEEQLGPYELHDFFLYHLVRNGFAPAKIRWLAEHASFECDYTSEQIARTLKTFIRRFFHNQFKRSCVPDGPKVGTVSLSPRGDWRMPSDAEVDAWLRDLEP